MKSQNYNNRVLALLALAVPLLLYASAPAQAQDFRLQHFDTQAIVVEAGTFRFVASVGTPTLGGPVMLQLTSRHGRTAPAFLQSTEELPTSYSLTPNYPNPFNPATTIGFVLPEAATVRLAVYDLLGRQVQLLVQDQRPAGRHEVTFEASGLPSGTYFYRIVAGDFTAVRKMMLVK